MERLAAVGLPQYGDGHDPAQVHLPLRLPLPTWRALLDLLDGREVTGEQGLLLEDAREHIEVLTRRSRNV